MILVVGSIGAIGRAVVNELAARGTAVRAMVRDYPDLEDRPAHGVTLVEADLRKPDTLDRALDGVDAVFLNSKDMPGYVDRESNVIDAAKRMGTPRLVKLTRPFATADTPSVVHRNHFAVTEHLRASGVPHTLVRPQAWMQNALLDAPTIQGQGVVYSALGDTALAYIDQRDAAAFIANTLLDDGHLDRDYLISGPALVPWPDVVAQISEAIGSPIGVIDMSIDDVKGAFLGMGIPEWFADAYAQLLEYAVTGPSHQVTTTFQDVVGRPPISFRQFIDDHKSAFVRQMATA